MTTKTRSLLSDIQWIVLVVSTGIIIAVAGVSLMIVSRTMLAELQARSLATADEMQALLEYPLYVVDDHQAVRIAETFLASTKISGILLESTANGILLSKTGGSASTRIAKISRDISRSGLLLGKFTIAFSDEEITRTQKRFAVISVAIVLALLLANGVANRLFIAPRVGRPFKTIGAAIENISAGNYQTPVDPTPYRDVNLLVGLINAMAAKIHLKNQEQKRVEEQQSLRLLRIQKQQVALIELAKNELISQGDFEKAAAFIVQTASDVIGLARTSVWLLSDDGAHLRCVDLFDRASGRHQRGAILAAKDFPRYFEALSTERTIAAHAAQTDERTSEFANNYLIPYGITSMLDAAVRFEGKVIGVICFEQVGQPRIWQEDEIAFAAACADGLVVTQANRQKAQAEQNLRESERKTRAIFDLAFGFVGLLTPDGRVVEANRTALDFAGVNRADVIGKLFWATPWWSHSEPLQDRLKEAVQKAAAGELVRFEATHHNKNGELFVIDFSLKPVKDEAGRTVWLIPEGRDITERLRMEQERNSLNKRLLQSQKMEAIGQLTGGIAHDFNNMLSVVLGQAQLAMMGLDPKDPVCARLHTICQAAERTADLVRQLLGFARRQTTDPKVLDLNEIISGMIKILRRVIGEDIELVWVPGRQLHKVKIDPSQLDQIMANLAVNARDAIRGVGKITIETENVTVDQDYASGHPDVVPGPYVMIGFSDDGCGMDGNTLNQIFEPFFTTKPVGKGTGLGLATVYGIVRQNSGFINVYSEIDKGTTFKIYLPGTDAAESKQTCLTPSQTMPQGTETVLVVEDDDMILDLTNSILNQQGYHVVTAKNPAAAIALVENSNETIHLLITDVVMPRMSGKELALRLCQLRPALKCLFMSGYTANVIAHHGVLDEGVWFIQKPFAFAALTNKVREVLDSC